MKTAGQKEAQCGRIMEKAIARAEKEGDRFGYPLEIMSSAIQYMTETEKARFHFAKTALMSLTPFLRVEARARLLKRRKARIEALRPAGSVPGTA